MKKTLTLSLLTLATLFSVFVIAGVMNKPFGKKMLYRSERCTGDLYQIVLVDYFREEHECAKRPNHPNITGPENADIFLLGDSFFNNEQNGEQFRNLLADRTPKKIWNVYNSFYPLEVLLKAKDSILKNPKRRILILETVERYLFHITEKTLLDDLSRRDSPVTQNEAKQEAVVTAQKNSNSQARLTTKKVKISRLEFSRYDYFFLNNIIVHRIYTAINSLRFYIFRTFSGATVSDHYSFDPPMLFLKDDIDYAETKRTESEIAAAAEKVETLKKIIKEKYNMDLLFIVLPNKYSMYGSRVDKNFVYDQTIPKTVKELRRRGVRTLDTYSLMKAGEKSNPSESLYLQDDTHWTMFGRSFVLDEIQKTLTHF